MNDIYQVNLRSYRAKSKKLVKKYEKCYEILEDKESEYAGVVKSLLNLHVQVYEIYNNAPDVYDS